MSVNTSSLSDIMFPNTNNTYDIINSIKIPASLIRHRSISTGKLLKARPWYHRHVHRLHIIIHVCFIIIL